MAFTRPNGPCPCGSGTAARACCWDAGQERFAPQPRDTQPPSPRTGYSHPQCYAAPLHDCSRRISREHYISKALLDVLGGGGPVKVSGLRWVAPAPTKEVGAKAFCSKVLCTRHNQALSPLDRAGARFFEALHVPHRGRASGQAAAWVTTPLVSGDDLERWFLKLLCGLLGSDSVAPGEGGRCPGGPKAAWLPHLFGARPLPRDTGLYLWTPPWELPDQPGLEFTPMAPDGDPIGLFVAFAGLAFVVNLSPICEDVRELLQGQSCYRPAAITFKGRFGPQEIILGWAHPGYATTVTVLSSIT